MGAGVQVLQSAGTWGLPFPDVVEMLSQSSRFGAAAGCPAQTPIAQHQPSARRGSSVVSPATLSTDSGDSLSPAPAPMWRAENQVLLLHGSCPQGGLGSGRSQGGGRRSEGGSVPQQPRCSGAQLQRCLAVSGAGHTVKGG